MNLVIRNPAFNIKVEYATSQKCGPSEEYLECGSSCPLTCQSNYSSTVCKQQCVEGCFCKSGLVRDEVSNECMELQWCPSGGASKCMENEEYRECGSACVASCVSPAPQLCTDQCVRGCFCKAGLLRDEVSGQCVAPSQCAYTSIDPEPQCGEFEEFQSCGSACPLNCTNRNNMTFCTKQCVQGCFCKKGYIRDETKNQCVLPSECFNAEERSSCNGVNEEYSECGSGCPNTCDSVTKDTAMDCAFRCVPGCFCKIGFYRNSNDECISFEECFKETLSGLYPSNVSCSKSETFSECGPTCEPSCENDTPICPKSCKRGCFCNEGLLRNSTGQCVEPYLCPVYSIVDL